VHRYTRDGPPALAVTVANHLASELRGSIGGKGLNVMQVKALEAPAVPLRWHRRNVEFTVPPGRHLKLFIEGVAKEELSIILKAQTPTGEFQVRRDARLDEMTLPSALELREPEAARWNPGPLPETATGMELAWRGREHKTREQAPSIPEEAREQLRALGYEQ
jgi:hypothetical protein